MSSSEPRFIDMSEWTASGGGAFSETYFHKSDSTFLLKMMAGNASEKDLKREFSNASAAYRLGLPTPEPGELVTDGKRIGILFKRMVDKISYARAIGQYPDRIDHLAKDFSATVKKLHATDCPEGLFPDVRVSYAELIRNNKFRSEAVRRHALDFLLSIPDCPTFLHGDLHFGNMVMSGGRSYIIDLTNLCHGHPYIDFGMIPALLLFSEAFPEKFVEDYHCTPEQATMFWHCFLKEYFGPGTDTRKKEEELKPYAALRLLSSETEFGAPVPISSADELLKCL